MNENVVKKVMGKLKNESGRILYLGIGLGVGYLIGLKYGDWKFNTNFARCIEMKPELVPMIREAIELCEKQ